MPAGIKQTDMGTKTPSDFEIDLECKKYIKSLTNKPTELQKFRIEVAFKHAALWVRKIKDITPCPAGITRRDMKHFKNYDRIIATKQMLAGNEHVGNMWNETKSFPKDTPIYIIIEWAKDCTGKLIITIDEETAEKDEMELNF